MKYVFLIIFSCLVSGCGPSLRSARWAHDRFIKENPGARVLAVTRREVIDPENTPPNNVMVWYGDFTIRYRDVDGAKREEVWHYKKSIHGWYFDKKEQTK